VGAAGADDDRPQRIPQMSTVRARHGGQTQSSGVKGVIALERLNLDQNWSWSSPRPTRMRMIFRTRSLSAPVLCNVCMVFLFSSFSLYDTKCIFVCIVHNMSARHFSSLGLL
jgi:hypothetical protein